MSISPSPSSLWFSSNSTNRSLFSASLCIHINKKRCPVVFYCKSGTGLTSEDKKKLLKQYGIDPDEFLSEQCSKIKRRKEVQKTGTGQKVVRDGEAQEERTTHRLLQVLGGTARRKKLLSPKGMDVRR